MHVITNMYTHTYTPHMRARTHTYTYTPPPPPPPPHAHIQHTVQAVKVIVREKGYVQPPPPGCPLKVYRLMVKCW